MRVIIACGGSGGHLFPGLAVAEELKKIDKNCEILIVGSKRDTDRKILKKEDYPFAMFPNIPMPDRISLKFIPFLIMSARTLMEAIFILKRIRPNMVVGFGGFTSGPILLGAWMLHIPTLIHEQNFLPGRANRILAKFVDTIALSFKESVSFFKEKDKIIFTGNPIRRSLNAVDKNEALKTFDFEPEKFTIFVMGGSQGAHSINEAVIKVFEKFSQQERANLQVIHICGNEDFNMLEGKYKKLGINSRLYSFLNKVDCAYCASDFVISRAGATAISEIIFFGKTSILIPYPYAHSHQLDNATYIKEHNMGIMLEDNEKLSEQLYNNILYFYNNRSEIEKYSRVTKEENAAKSIVELILNLKDDDKS